MRTVSSGTRVPEQRASTDGSSWKAADSSGDADQVAGCDP
jgi:hypothetical protein